MHRRIDQIVALFDPKRGGIRFAGFVFGAVVPLVLMAVVSAIYSGGMSDTISPGEQAYIIE